MRYRLWAAILYFVIHEFLFLAGPFSKQHPPDQHNMEFSCRPESNQRELINATDDSGYARIHGGQLQRFVMITIRVMAWRKRTYFIAHAVRATPCIAFSCQRRACGFRNTRSQPALRASNSGGPCPRHHICLQIQHSLRTIRVMARPERAYHPHMRQKRLLRRGL
jgi:hypothetical protein